MKIDESCDCPRCHVPPRFPPLFVAIIVMMVVGAVLACFKIHDRSGDYIYQHQGEITR